MQEHIIKISELSHYIQTLISLDPFLQTIWITGELSNVKTYSKGNHCYFTLSEEDNQIQCVIFGSNRKKENVPLKNGDTIFAYGKVTYYAKRGQLSFQASEIKPSGAGQKSAAFLKLQKKLKAEGLFDDSRKIKLPKYPEKIAIITAKNSAAEADILRITNSNAPKSCIELIHATVQGPNSSESLLKALNKAKNIPNIELILLGRGGGSSEDLSSFNEEIFVRAISNCPIPTITGIGHESDATLAEQVADYRAATPTHAASIATQGYQKFNQTLLNRLKNIDQQLKKSLEIHHNHIEYLLSNLKSHPKLLEKQLNDNHNSLLKRITQCNPLLRLQQGYTISYLENKKSINNVILNQGDLLYTETNQDIIQSTITDITKKGI